MQPTRRGARGPLCRAGAGVGTDPFFPDSLCYPGSAGAFRLGCPPPPPRDLLKLGAFLSLITLMALGVVERARPPPPGARLGGQAQTRRRRVYPGRRLTAAAPPRRGRRGAVRPGAQAGHRAISFLPGNPVIFGRRGGGVQLPRPPPTPRGGPRRPAAFPRPSHRGNYGSLVLGRGSGPPGGGRFLGSRHALSHRSVRDLLPDRAGALLGADVAPAAVEAVHRGRELRLLRRGELALLLPAGRHHARQPAGRRADLADRGRARPQAAAGPRRRARPRRAGRLQVLLVLRPAGRRRAAPRRPGDAVAAGDDRPAGRHQLLHLPGDLLRRRRQAPPGRARPACSTSPST